MPRRNTHKREKISMSSSLASRRTLFLASLALCPAWSLCTATETHRRQLTADWTWGHVLPRPCSAFGCVAGPSGIITVGGTYWSSPDSGNAEKRWMRDVCRLTPKAASWERLPDYPTDAGQLLAVWVNNGFYAIGGRNAERSLHETYRLSPDNLAAGWQRGPNLPRPLYGLGGGARGSVVYVVTDEEAMRQPGDPAPPPPQVLTLDTANADSAWIELAKAPDAAVGFHAATLAGGNLFLFGGASQNEEGSLELRDTVWSFDLDSKTWSSRHRLPYPLRDASAVALNERFILVAGGVEDAMSAITTPDGQPRILLSNRCLLYDAVEDQFTFAPPLRLAVADQGLVMFDSAVLVVAGEDSPYRTRTDLVQQIGVEGILQAADDHEGSSRSSFSPADRGARSPNAIAEVGIKN